MNKIILASKSPRRQELLTQIRIPFEVRPSTVNEVISGNSPEEIVMNLSRQKCEDSASAELRDGSQRSLIMAGEDRIVLGADTIVVLDRQILGKPKSYRDAVDMLTALQGRAHQVYTGVTLARLSASDLVQEESFAVCTEVEIYPMTVKEIKDYVATGDPADKAGSYGIQGEFARYIRGIRGDYNNVVGLPVSEVYQHLKAWGFFGLR
jgi:septum formation protein